MGKSGSYCIDLLEWEYLSFVLESFYRRAEDRSAIVLLDLTPKIKGRLDECFLFQQSSNPSCGEKLRPIHHGGARKLLSVGHFREGESVLLQYAGGTAEVRASAARSILQNLF